MSGSSTRGGAWSNKVVLMLFVQARSEGTCSTSNQFTGSIFPSSSKIGSQNLIEGNRDLNATVTIASLGPFTLAET